MVDVSAHLDYVHKTMLEKMPTSFAPLKALVVPEGAAGIEEKIRIHHQNGGKSTGWATNVILDVVIEGTSATIRSCSDSTGWKRVGEGGREEFGLRVKLRTVQMVRDDMRWLVQSNAYEAPSADNNVQELCS
ncbi:MAG: hypothetical protein ACRC0L_08260 [Angustibacter sp.]